MGVFSGIPFWTLKKATQDVRKNKNEGCSGGDFTVDQKIE